MGCEGHISIAQVIEGAYFLEDHRNLPWFRVTEPVAILHARRDWFHGRDNFTCGAWNKHLSFNDPGLWLPDVRYPKTMFVVTQLDIVKKIYNIAAKQYEEENKWDNRLTSGAIGLEHLIPYWEKITPGFWILTKYLECGTWDDFCWSLSEPEWMRLGPEIGWECWT